MPAGVKLVGLDKVLKTIESKSIAIQKEVDAELTAGAVEIRDLAKQFAPVYESKLRGAIVADTNTPLKKEVTCNVYYAAYIEFGTGRKVKIPAGLEAIAAQFKNQPKRGSFDEMVGNIAGWLRKKGGDPKQAKFVAIMILKNGIRPQPYFFRAFDAKKPSIINNIKRVVTK